MNWWLRFLRALARRKPAPEPPIDVTPPKFPPVTDLVAILNEARIKHGVPPVIEMESLDEAAKIQADWQAQRDQIGHDGPPGLPWQVDRMRAAGVPVAWESSGEICAGGQRAYWPDGSLAIDYDWRKACADWLASPGHRAILLDPKFTHAGAWMTENRRGRIYSTAVFIKRG